MRSVKFGFLTIGILFAAGSAHGANLIRNGGFEAPATPAGSYTLYSNGQTIQRWKVVGASGNVATVSTSFTQNGIDFPAKGGKAYLELTGTSNTATGVAQNVVTVPGTTYTLRFFVGNTYDPGGIFGVSSTVDVYAGSTLLLAATNAIKTKGANQTWKAFSVSYTATSTRTVFSFINGDPSSDTNNGLNNVSLTANTASASPALLNGLAK